MDPNWREILEKIERGELTPEEGASRMGQTGEPTPEPAPAAQIVAAEPPASSPPAESAPPPSYQSEEPAPAPDPAFEARLNYWKRWWQVPLFAGTGIFLLGAALIAWGHTSQLPFWFVCGFFPLLFGLFVMGIAWWSQGAHWVHVRVNEQAKEDRRGTKVSISMPLPISLTSWFLRTFGRTIPGLREQEHVLETLPDLLRELDRNHEPIVVEVNDNNAEVRVYIT